MNRVTLIGRLGQDPETQDTKTGGIITKFSLATDDSYRDKDGNKVEQTDWHNIVAFGKQAEVLSKYLKKGDMLAIEGKVKYSSYEKDGIKMYYTNINLERFTFLPSSGENTSKQTATQASNAEYKTYEQHTNSAPQPQPQPESGDELPF